MSEVFRSRGSDSCPPPSGTPPADPVEELLYIITHDLRAGFRAFNTIPDWIAEDLSPLPPEKQAALDGHVEMLRTQARRCDRMLTDLREYSRVGRMAEPAAEHTPDMIVGRALEQVQLPAGFELRIRAGGTLRGAGNELAALMAALISNSVKHHDRAGGVITIEEASTSTDDARGAPPLRQILFSDDGPGIPVRHHEDAFKMLRTLRSRDDCEGSGMGLPLARKIAERHGGSIEILDHGDERGTVLLLRLPGTPGSTQRPI